MLVYYILSSNAMMTRRPHIDDIGEFERISRTYEDNPLVTSFETCAVVDDNGVKAFGFTRALLEVVMYGSDARSRARGYNELLAIAKGDAKKLGFGQLYAFVDPSFATILEKRGWKQAKGVCVILELNDGKQ